MQIVDKNDIQIKQNTIVRWVIAILTILLYAVFYIADGAVIGVDTQGYINMVISREVGYSLWVNLFLNLFGKEIYAEILVLCQMILAAATMYVFTSSIAKIWKVRTFSVFVIWGIQVVFLLLCRFGSGLGAIYPSTVLTEGLTYPLYFLYIKTILQLNEEVKVKRVLEVFVYCVLMMLIRTHLAVTFLGVIAFFFLKAVCKKLPWKKWFLLMAGSILGMVLVLMVGKVYSYVVHGVTNGVVGSNSFIVVSGLYGADESDIELFTTKEDRTLFKGLYELCEQNGLNYKFISGDSMFPYADHYSESFDRIKFGTVMAYMRQYYEEKGVSDSVELEISMDEKSKELGWPLLKDNFEVKMKITVEDFGRSFMRTIGKASRIMVPYTLVAYGMYIVLMLYGLKEKRYDKTVWGGLFVLIMILGNITATSFMIFGEPRYLLYNMVPFYVMGYLLLRNMWMIRKERNI